MCATAHRLEHPLAMVIILSLAGHLMALHSDCHVSGWEVATAIKSQLKIPRRQQQLYVGSERLLMTAKIPADSSVTLIRQEIVCKVCSCGGDRRKHRLCSGCLDVSYCSKRCQRIDWSTHRTECISTQKHAKARAFLHDSHNRSRAKPSVCPENLKAIAIV